MRANEWKLFSFDQSHYFLIDFGRLPFHGLVSFPQRVGHEDGKFASVIFLVQRRIYYILS
jgi:hypothetical protein